jgi:poly-gamma-glutamate synthesis protein (capsule biosynthesis protein)
MVLGVIAFVLVVSAGVAYGLPLLAGWLPSVTPGPTSSATKDPTAAVATEAATPTPPPATPTVEPTPTKPAATPGPVVEIRLLDIGDILLHTAVIKSYLLPSGEYDFDRIFKTLGGMLSKADLAFADMEGTLAGTPYSNFPRFSVPDAIATALFNAGIDVSVTANNHMYDRGTAGLLRTVSVLRAAGLTVAGTRADVTEPIFQLLDRKGIRIGVAAYTFETPSSDGKTRINGLPLESAAVPLINTFNPYAADFADDIARMCQVEKDMREAGAELTVFVLHWGDEYRTTENAYQKRLAQALADAGVDVVFGQHPHSVQGISVLTSEDGTHEMPVFYSVGNFASNMIYSTNGTKGITEDGIIAGVTVRRSEDGTVRVVSADYLPIYCYKVHETRHETVPATDPRADPRSLDRTRAIIGDEVGTETLPVKELTFTRGG